MFDSAQTNILWDGEVAGRSPDAEGDFYTVADAQIDHNYWQEKIVDSLLAISSLPNSEFLIIYGGSVIDSGSGQVDISECMAIGKNSLGDRRIIRIPTLTNIALPSGWNDGRSIWVIARHDFKLSSATRTHRAGILYHYQTQDTYMGDSNGYVSTGTDDLFVDSDPIATDVILGKFTMTGTTFLNLNVNSPTLNILNADKHDGTDVQTILDSVSDLNVPTSKATADYIKSIYIENLGSITNSAGTPNTIIDFGVGKSWSDDYTTWIADVVGMSKTSGSWVAGTGNGMLDTGSFSASKVYYLYRIWNGTTFAVDYLMSLSSNAPTMPSGYTKKRLIGAVLTDASTHFIAANFSRPTKDIFQCIYKSPINDRAAGVAGNTARNLLTISAPIGSIVKLIARLQAESVQSANTEFLSVGSTFETDVSPGVIESCACAMDSSISGVYGMASAEPTAIVDSNQQIFWRIAAMSGSNVSISIKAWQLSL